MRLLHTEQFFENLTFVTALSFIRSSFAYAKTTLGSSNPDRTFSQFGILIISPVKNSI